ncbi:DNA primase [Carbonactinospora thermoautotrophica]|uniref:bifunctional DNA primase/polymerase n=1 Tax=Carbonactinospora thermoautotrophica TaxID=1469144 RepID=UPI00226F7B25|nr:bifunctional DNA primase/polymerase [Carbonactinospora thermoautotrophica]MCX9190261.1 DNA primase [Carbonactinospora thermoautotrophica]
MVIGRLIGRVIGRRRTRAARRAALWYAVNRRWDVAPGTHPVPRWSGLVTSSVGCSCGRPDCRAPGAHPIDPCWLARATDDPTTVEWWWSRYPNASIVLPTGRSFDVIDVPEAAGRRALDRLDRLGVPLGPVAATRTGRYLFFVVPGAREELPALLDWQDWPDIDLGLRCHGEGDYVIAPALEPLPRSATWWVRPPGDTNRRLPEAHLVIGTLAHACQRASLVRAQLIGA